MGAALAPEALRSPLIPRCAARVHELLLSVDVAPADFTLARLKQARRALLQSLLNNAYLDKRRLVDLMGAYAQLLSRDALGKVCSAALCRPLRGDIWPAAAGWTCERASWACGAG